MDDSIGIGDIAALVTVAGVAIYVLGLVGLAIPIRRTFTDNISAAWYAVSLSPKTVVAGQGVRIWTQWTIVIVALMLLGAASVRLLDLTGLGIINEEKSVFLNVLASALAYSGFTVVVSMLTIYVARRNALRTRAMGLLHRRSSGTRILEALISAAAILTGVLLAMVVVVLVVPGALNNLLYIALIFIGSFLIGLPTTITAAPPLPKVRTTKRLDGTIAEEVPNPIEGWLVAHTDGFWHLFVLVEEQRELLAIPDGEVLIVRVLAEGSASPEEPAPQENTKSGAGKDK